MTSRREFLLGAAAWSALAVSATASAATPAPEPLAIVAAPQSALTGLSLFRLKMLYLGERMVAPDGTALIPLNRGLVTPERLAFDRLVLSMNPEQVSRYWIERRIRGLSGAPRAVDPSIILERVVARLAGSVGYVLLNEVTSSVKVLQIDGRYPWQSGYPILAPVTALAPLPEQLSPSRERHA